MNSQYQDQNSVAGGGRLHRDGTTIIRALKRRSGAALVAALLGTMAPLTIAAHAQQHVALAGPVHARTITVTLGKSQDVQTEQSIADIVVSDPSVADVNPLTDRRLSIFGKKSGTTRVTVYDADKKPIGIFDIEVGFDISPLRRGNRAVHQRPHQGVVDQRPHHAVRHRAGRRHARQGRA